MWHTSCETFTNSNSYMTIKHYLIPPSSKHMCPSFDLITIILHYFVPREMTLSVHSSSLLKAIKTMFV